MRPRGHRFHIAGVGLFDAMVSLAILSFGMLAMTRFQGRMVAQTTESQSRQTATQLAAEHLSSVLVDVANAPCYTKPQSGTDSGIDTRALQRRVAAERRAELAPVKKAMERAEKTVEKLSLELAKLDAALGDPALYARDPAKAKQISIERGQLAKKLEQAEDAWLSATDAYESAASETVLA